MNAPSDGRPLRVVRYNGSDQAVYLRDNSSGAMSVSVYMIDRVGNDETSAPEALEACSNLVNAIRIAVEARTKMELIINGRSAGVAGNGNEVIQSREQFSELLCQILDTIDPGVEGDADERYAEAAEQLLKSAMEASMEVSAPAKHPQRGPYMRCFGRVALHDLDISRLRTAVERLLHQHQIDGRIIYLSQEDGNTCLNMVVTPTSGNALKKIFDIENEPQ